MNLSGGNLGGIGAVTVSGPFTWTGGTLVGSGGMTISGTATVSGSANKILNQYSLINTGTITWTQGIIRFNNSAQIDNQATGSFNLDSGTNLNLGWSSAISGTFTNAGTLSKNGAGTAYFNIPLTNSGTLNIHAGTLKPSSNITSTGMLKGNGTLDASSINFVNAGQLSPGTSAGVFNFIGNYQQSSNGALNIEIAGTGSADYDQLAISANADVSGTLDISLLSSFTPANGNSFTIVTFAVLSGLFTQINYPVLYSGLAWRYRARATNIQLYCGTDTDRDGLTDTLENTTCTDTNNGDTDDDDLLDGEEDLNKNGQKESRETDPCDEDTDDDTMPDGWEADHGLDPLDPSDCGDDPDEDNLDNCGEYFYGTDPNNADSDADGMPDGWEVDNNFDPLVDDALEDADQDGYSNLREYLSESDPWDHMDLPPLIADVDADNDCDGYDLAMFMLEYGDDCDTILCDYDLDLDGDIDEIDLFLLAEDYGRID